MGTIMIIIGVYMILFIIGISYSSLKDNSLDEEEKNLIRDLNHEIRKKS